MSGQSENVTEKKELLYPALYQSTRTTLPILAEIMTTISVALLPLTAIVVENTETVWGDINTKHLALTMFGVSAMLCWMAVEACINSYAWDYFALEEKRRKYENISEDQLYINACLKENEFWYKFAIWIYRLGSGCILLGVMCLLWAFSHATVLTLLVVLALISISVAAYKHRRLNSFLRYHTQLSSTSE